MIGEAINENKVIMGFGGNTPPTDLVVDYYGQRGKDISYVAVVLGARREIERLLRMEEFELSEWHFCDYPHTNSLNNEPLEMLLENIITKQGADISVNAQGNVIGISSILHRQTEGDRNPSSLPALREVMDEDVA